MKVAFDYGGVLDSNETMRETLRALLVLFDDDETNCAVVRDAGMQAVRVWS